MADIKQTCLHSHHVSLGALMSPFGGFDMPIQYAGIVEEHNAVRNAVGVFDVSHMGEVRITGPQAERFVNHIFTNDVSTLETGKILYGMMLYPDGGTVDDLLVYKMGENDFFLVINAANIDKDVAWINEHAEGYDVSVAHQSDYYGQLAVQGPESEATLRDVLHIDAADLVFYTFKCVECGGEQVIVSRTGYTGEDGFEVGLPLYGDELSAEISPVMATLSMFVKLDKEEFIGKDACAQQKAEGSAKKLVGLELKDKAIPRHGYEVLQGDKVVGYVTTGYRGISVDKSLAMALVDREAGALDNELSVRIRKKVFPAVVVKKRFYKKSYKK
ncbi:MAG: glycine cleavage system protein T [Muribaculaceae bacterium]|nr:glycine cleavage system protein T [Muribaculaceae bacterium]